MRAAIAALQSETKTGENTREGENMNERAEETGDCSIE